MTQTIRKVKVRKTRGTLKAASSIAGVSRAVLVAYCESGVLPYEIEELDRRDLDDETVRTIRRIEYLREQHGINLAGIRIIAGLMREVERLREELRFRMGV